MDLDLNRKHPLVLVFPVLVFLNIQEKKKKPQILHFQKLISDHPLKKTSSSKVMRKLERALLFHSVEVQKQFPLL